MCDHSSEIKVLALLNSKHRKIVDVACQRQLYPMQARFFLLPVYRHEAGFSMFIRIRCGFMLSIEGIIMAYFR